MNCPICNVGLNLSDRSGVEIDYCPKCRGIWLDRGELDKIIERSKTHFQGEPANHKYFNEHEYFDEHEHDSHYDEHGSYKKHKKKSFLEDIFDFG